MTQPSLLAWLHGLDSYTNAEFGRAVTLSGSHVECVACGVRATPLGPNGWCEKCEAKRRPDDTEIVLFRALRRATPTT